MSDSENRREGVVLTVRQYMARGWSPLPVPYREKNPNFKGWEQFRLLDRDVDHMFGREDRNVGVHTGEPSGWLVDVDLDYVRCIELADDFLPPTPMIFGRVGKPRSHRFYKITGPAATKKFRSKSVGMLIEFRSTGCQTVVPPSIHEVGEAILWEPEAEGAEPSEVDPELLLDAVTRIANQVKEELGERAAPKKKRAAPAAGNGDGDEESGAAKRKTKKAHRCLAAMLRMDMVDHNDGSSRLYAAACRCVEHDLSDADAVTMILAYAKEKPFPQEWGKEQILDRIRQAERNVDRGVVRRQRDGDKVKVLIDTEEHRVITETIQALTKLPDIYRRGGTLVDIIRDEARHDGIDRPSGAATIRALPAPCLRERMTKVATFTQMMKQGDVSVEVLTHPTPWLVSAIDARGSWPGIRPLNAISDTPILRPDGTIWQTAGYDATTGVLYQPNGLLEFPEISPDVGIDDADAAVAALSEVVCDFRFEGKENHAAYLAGVLTPVATFAYDGPSPFFLVDANIRGAGKGLLVQTTGRMITGAELPVSSYAHDPEEMRKKITAIAIAGDRMIHLDNLEGHFGNDALDRALTSTRWKDRVLGKSEQIDLPLRAIWYGTGNNVAVAADTARRILHIRLDVLEERPEDRTDFRHPDLLAWIGRNRARLLTSALTILVAYYNAGKPKQGLTAFGSFEGWSSIVREALVWAGLPDPCQTQAKLAETSDTTTDTLAQLIRAWQAYDAFGKGVVIAEMIARLYPDERQYGPKDEAAVAMRSALEALVDVPHGKVPMPRQVGNRMKSFRRRVYSGVYLDSLKSEDKRAGATWRLFRLDGQRWAGCESGADDEQSHTECDDDSQSQPYEEATFKY